MTYNQIFLGQNDNDIVALRPDNFSKYFDWIMMPVNRNLLTIYKQSQEGKTIYLKTDFLPAFVNSILPKIDREFILITCCSDYSPEINFKREYNILINSNNLKYWFMANMRNKHPKTFSLPVGLSSFNFGGHPSKYDPLDIKYVEDLLMEYRNNSIKNKEKVFCCFRNRNFNDAGSIMIIRPQIYEIVKNNPDVFDFYEPGSLSFSDFIKTISNYKYSLCPHGNGLDPSPTAWISLILKVTPIIYETPNSIDMFSESDSVIYFNNIKDIINPKIYVEKPPIDFQFLTLEYWANKIKSKI
jgi:hypothetical protein